MTITDDLHRILLEDFMEIRPGEWYPAQSGTALVRVMTDEDSYTIERRRTAAQPWTELVTARRATFDVDSFQAWASSFKMTT